MYIYGARGAHAGTLRVCWLSRPTSVCNYATQGHLTSFEAFVARRGFEPLNLQVENLTSWTTRRTGHVCSGKNGAGSRPRRLNTVKNPNVADKPLLPCQVEISLKNTYWPYRLTYYCLYNHYTLIEKLGIEPILSPKHSLGFISATSVIVTPLGLEPRTTTLKVSSSTN